MADSKPPLLVVVGPTASGKTELAVSLAQRLGGEVVSADSVQVYRYFDVGSGKPTPEELGRAPHHLIDIADPLDTIEANVWAQRAQTVIEDVARRGRVPIVCGGTFLWIRALLHGLAEAPPGDEAIRTRHQREAESSGRPALHEKLQAVDPASAARLHPNDLVRVSRALEVFELTGRRLSELQEEHGFRQSRYDAHLLAVGWEKAEYEARLAGRVQAMWDAGWKQEVQSLIERGYGRARAMDAVGYRQVKEALKSPDEAVPEDEVVASIVRVTRVFARRQRTWLRDVPVRQVSAVTLTQSAALDILSRELQSLLDPRRLR